MKALLLFGLFSLSASAQTLPWIDLSGNWHYTTGDDPHYSNPSFDDSKWPTVHLPGDLPVNPGQYFWLRQTFPLPSTLHRAQLALTLGKLIEDYDLFVNGTRIWTSGPLDPAHTLLARPRTFDLPLLQDDRLNIAVRGWSHAFRGSNSWRRGRDSGPYLLTSVLNAPRERGYAAIEHMRMQRTLDLVLGAVLLTLTVILLLMFVNEPSRQELLWLALYCAVVAWTRLDVVLLITPAMAPWNQVTPVPGLHVLFLLEFTMSALAVRSRVIRAAAWGSLVLYLIFPSSMLVNPAVRVLQLLAAVVAIWSLSRRAGRTPERLLITAGVSAVFVTDLLQNSVNGSMFERVRTPIVAIGPYQISLHPAVLSVFAFIMVTVLIRRLLRDRAEKQRMAGELEAARTVQQLLFPAFVASSGEYAVDAVYEPSQEVGGDFYQVLDRADGSRLIVVGDVSGKGLKAAMLVSVAVGVLLREKSSSPAVVLGGLNEALAGHTGGGFITCCCLRVEPGGRATVANAGHPPPYLQGKEMNVEAAALPLGILTGASYPESVYEMALGDRITLVSDGVVEAANAKRELFGFERTRELSGGSASEIANAAKAFGQNDDITVVTVERS